MLKQRAGIPAENFTHINYNGSAPALTDVIAGRVPLMFDIWHSARRHVESGALKLIASASGERLPGAPDGPTMAESYPGFEVMAFNAIVATGGTPAPIVERLSADIRAVVASEAFKEKTQNLGINAYGNTPAEISAWMTREIARWKGVAQAANIKAE
jgi:tripartite-type tricarboxylate transporter receptor subunit TctC